MTEKRFPMTEISIALAFTMCLLWFLNDYIAFFLSLFLSSIALSLLVISFITELIEKSKLPNWYFRLMWILVVVPVLIALLFGCVNGFKYQWLQG